MQIDTDEAGKEVELGRGAFGVVVKGRYRLMPVAIKRLLQQSPEQQAQFLKEMAILRACRGSRYIVPFVGASLQPVSPLFHTQCHSADHSAPGWAEAQHWPDTMGLFSCNVPGGLGMVAKSSAVVASERAGPRASCSGAAGSGCSIGGQL